jgi:UDP-N-acetylglucosamine transferase subunit ALG13
MYSKKVSQQTPLLELLNEVAGICMSRVHISFDQVDILLNTSVFNENYMSEPAIAALLQKMLCKGAYSKKQFSLDINCGQGGVIQALQMGDAMIKNGDARLVLVVSGDTQPLVGDYSEIRITNSAGAILLGKSEKTQYIQAFHSENYLEHLDKYQSYISWENPIVKMNHKITEDYYPSCEDAVLETIRNYVQGLTTQLTNPVIVSNLPKINLQKIAKNLRMDFVMESFPHSHSASLICSLHENKDLLRSNKDILIITCSPGISISLVHYKNPTP